MSDDSHEPARSEAPTPLWRLCEVAWGSWLASQGLVVTPLADATGNSAGTRAPLAHLGRGAAAVRAPDFLTASAGKMCYWEVKSRLGPSMDPLTGNRQHWIERTSLFDYLRLSEASGIPVNVILHERGTSSDGACWLMITVEDIRARGTRSTVTAADGTSLDVLMWPREAMTRVEGPRVDAHDSITQILPLQPENDIGFAATLELYERASRRRPARVSETPAGSVTPAPTSPPAPGGVAETSSNPLLADRLAGLEVLRRRLGIPFTPRYSVLRVGEVDPDVFGLLDYGIRVFLLLRTPATARDTDERQKAFEDTRLLERSICPDLEPSQEHWQVDGRSEGEEPAWLPEVLASADCRGNLNHRQYAIVHAPAGSDVLVTAGAGTGKTETMTERLLFLLATVERIVDEGGARHPHHLRLDEISIVTFSREAASEIRERVARTIARRQRLCRRCVLPTTAWLSQLGRMQLSTIHAFARRLIADSGSSIGISPDFRVGNAKLQLESLFARALSDRLARRFATEGPTIPPIHLWQKHVQALWEALQNNGIRLWDRSTDEDATDCISWGQASDEAGQNDVAAAVRTVIERVRREFFAYCEREQLVPTGQLVPTALRALGTSTERLRRPLRFLFVDEFQDTDTEQMDMLLHLRRSYDARLFVVGDVKQGIYRFRGAEGNAFDALRQRVASRGMDAMQEFPLNRNFRTGKRLLDSLHPLFLAWGEDHLLRYTPSDRLEPGLPNRPSTPLRRQTVHRQREFATDSERVVAEWRVRDPTERIAILCRRNQHAIAVKTAIGPSCDLLVGGEFFQSPAVVETRALLQAILDPDDDAAVLELAETRWGAGLAARQSAPGRVDDEDAWRRPLAPLLSWRDRFVSIAGAGRFAREDLDGFRSRVRLVASLMRSTPAIAFLVLCRDWFLSSSLPADADGRRYERCLDHLVTVMDARFADSPVTLVGIIEWLRLQIATNRTEDEPYGGEVSGETIALTVHKAKGLEFDRVLIPNTWTRFGPPRSATTRTAVVREGNEAARLLWKWEPSGTHEYSNSLPDDRRLWTIDEDEVRREETRLLYVAMTRAKHELRVLMPAQSRPETWAQLLAGQ